MVEERTQWSLPRLATSLLVSLMVGFGSWAAVGFASADAGDITADSETQASNSFVPRSFALPQRSVGEYTLHEFNQFDKEEFPYNYPSIEQELLGQEEVRGADGTLRNGFVVQSTERDNATQRWLIDSETMHPTMIKAYSEKNETEETPYGEVNKESHSESIQFLPTVRDPLPHCLHANPFQGKDADLHKLEWPGCSFAASMSWFEVEDATGPEVISWKETNLGKTLHIRMVDDETESTIELWYAEGISVAVRADVYSNETESGLSGTFTLVQYRLGDETVTLPNIEDSTRLPDIEMVPWIDPWPDDSDLEQPFPMSFALETARDAPSFTLLRDFLDVNPDGYTSHFLHSSHQTERGSAHYWFVRLQGNTDSESLVLTLVKIPDPIMPGTPIGVSSEGEFYFAMEGGWTSNSWTTPKERPSEFPSYADLVLWSDAFSNEAYTDLTPYVEVISWHDEAMPFSPGEPQIRAGRTTFDVSFLSGMGIQEPMQEEQPTLNWIGQQLSLAGTLPMYHWTLSHMHSAPDLPVVSIDEPTPIDALGPPANNGEHKGTTQVEALQWQTPSAKATVWSGAAALVIGAIHWSFSLIKQLPIWGMFSRLQTPILLEHPSRVKIHSTISNDPGIRFSTLAQRVNLANGTLRHHLQMLIDGGLVERQETGAFTCYFVPTDATAENTAIAGAVQSDGARTVLECISSNPGCTARAIANQTGLALGTVGYHVKKLRDASIIASERQGREVRLSLA